MSEFSGNSVCRMRSSPRAAKSRDLKGSVFDRTAQLDDGAGSQDGDAK